MPSPTVTMIKVATMDQPTTADKSRTNMGRLGTHLAWMVAGVWPPERLHA